MSVPLADFDTTINWSYVVDVCSRLARLKQIKAGTFVVSHSYETPQTRLRRLYTRKNESRCEGALLLPSGPEKCFWTLTSSCKRPCVLAAPSPPERWQEYFHTGQTSGQTFTVMYKRPSKTFSSTTASYGRYRPPPVSTRLRQQQPNSWHGLWLLVTETNSDVSLLQKRWGNELIREGIQRQCLVRGSQKWEKRCNNNA